MDPIQTHHALSEPVIRGLTSDFQAPCLTPLPWLINALSSNWDYNIIRPTIQIWIRLNPRNYATTCQPNPNPHFNCGLGLILSLFLVGFDVFNLINKWVRFGLSLYKLPKPKPSPSQSNSISTPTYTSQFLELGTKLDSEFNSIKSIQQTTSQLWELQNKNCGHVDYWYRIPTTEEKMVEISWPKRSMPPHPRTPFLLARFSTLSQVICTFNCWF